MDALNEAAIKILKKEKVDQWTFVIEEIGELLQARGKYLRGKGPLEDIVEEACDVLNSVYFLLYLIGVSDSEIEARRKAKMDRMIERYLKKGEI